MIERRVGRERVVECLEGVSKQEFYIRAAQRPQPLAKHGGELLLEYQFTKLYKALEQELVKIFRPEGDPSVGMGSHSQHQEVVVQSYKKLIKQQDEKIAELIQEVKTLREQQQQQQQAVGVVSQPTCNGYPPEMQGSVGGGIFKNFEFKIVMAWDLEKLRQLEEKEQLFNQRAGVETQLEQLTLVAQQWQAEAEKYKKWAQQWQSYQLSQLPDGGSSATYQQLVQQQAETEEQLQYGWKAFESQVGNDIDIPAGHNLDAIAEPDPGGGREGV